MDDTSRRRTVSAELRARLDHPVIDGDGHMIESQFVFPDFLKQVGGPAIVDRFQKEMAKPRSGRPKALFWAAHAGKGTLDRVSCMLPRLYAQRLEEAGVDFATLYPTFGFRIQTLADDELRQAGCRALNMMYAELFASVKRNMTPAALIPMHTPAEAVAELEFAVRKLGLKAAMIAAEVLRPFPEAASLPPELRDHVTRYSSIGLDSPYDYDPFWAKCVELKVAPASHAFNFTGTHASPTSYLYNRIGFFATSGHAATRSLFLSGVTQRFPSLNIAFLEGGVWWAAALYNDLFEFWEKRNVDALLERHDPAKIDIALMEEMYRRFGDQTYLTPERLVGAKAALMRDGRTEPGKLPAFIDEWKHLKISKAEDIRDSFVDNFYFGCEADDAMNYTAFNTKANKFGARLRAMFSSDLGHWDVVDFGDVLHEAYEAVEHGLMDEDDFRAFVYENPVRFAARGNPDYFKDTVVEEAAAKVMQR